MKPKYLYHGSPKKIVGNELIPHQAHDLGKRPENLHKAVYATSERKLAIAMAIISSKGVIYSSLRFSGNPPGIIYQGWPEQEKIYLYTLPVDTFQPSGHGGKQWVSFQPVQPVKVEELLIKDYLYLVRQATREEFEHWIKKYNFLFRQT